MTMLKMMLKLIAMPVSLALTLLFWLAFFLTACSGALCCLFAAFCFLLSIACYLTGVSTGAEAIETLLMGFVVFLLPIIAGWLLERLTNIRFALKDFIQS